MNDVSGNESHNDSVSNDLNQEEIQDNENVQYSEIVVNSIDYTNYFENLQTMSILILACLVAIGCFLGWVGAKRE